MNHLDICNYHGVYGSCKSHPPRVIELRYQYLKLGIGIWYKYWYEFRVSLSGIGICMNVGYLYPGWYFPCEPTNFVGRKFSKSQEILKNMR